MDAASVESSSMPAFEMLEMIMLHRTMSRVRAGHVFTTSLVLVCVGGLCAAAITSLPGRPAARTPEDTLPAEEELTGAELAAALSRVGIFPESLAAAGLSGEEARGVIAAAASHLGERAAAMRAAQAELGRARGDHDRLEALVRSGRASDEQAAALESAREAWAAARAQLEGFHDGLFTAAVGDASEEQIAALRLIRTNAGRELPVRYLAQSRTDEQWLNLRDALAHRRIASHIGEEVCQDAAAVCLRAESDSALVHAQLEANLLAVTAVWEAGVGL